MASGPHFQPSFSEFGPPAMYDYDMVVIGSGPSGRRAAVQFAKLGRSVLVVEKGRRAGGGSVHPGTIPSKTLPATALNLSPRPRLPPSLPPSPPQPPPPHLA